MTMKVAHFIQRYPPALGGSEAYFKRLSHWRRDQGDDVTVWTSTAIDLSAFWASGGQQLRPGDSREDGVTVRRYEPSHWFARRHLLKLISFLPVAAWQCLSMTCNPVSLRMLYDALTEEMDCELVHASALPYGWPLYCAMKLAQRKKAPFLLTPFLHLGDLDDARDRTRRIYTSRPMRYLLAAADQVFAQTELECQALMDIGISSERVVKQGMGVDPAECTRGERLRAREDWGCSSDECVIGHLANLSPPKGTIDLLRAARRAWEDGARFRLILAGPRMPEFNRFWENFAPKERVTMAGVLSDEQKRDFYAGIDAFCLPSRSDSFGLVLLEAWANGKPTIGYRAGGIGELIHDGDDGWLVRCGDIEQLATALRATENDPSRRETMGEMGRQRTGREFRWEDKLRIVDESINRLIVNPGKM